MHLIPTEEEVLALIRRTGALRNGHFAYANGLHANQHLEAALALRYHGLAKTLTVGLSRLLRSNPDVRQMIPQLSVVAATVVGLPVAYGLCEALHARQVYWAEKESPGDMRFPQYLEQALGEQVLLVDDILRSQAAPGSSRTAGIERLPSGRDCGSVSSADAADHDFRFIATVFLGQAGSRLLRRCRRLPALQAGHSGGTR